MRGYELPYRIYPLNCAVSYESPCGVMRYVEDAMGQLFAVLRIPMRGYEVLKKFKDNKGKVLRIPMRGYEFHNRLS